MRTDCDLILRTTWVYSSFRAYFVKAMLTARDRDEIAVFQTKGET